MENFVVNQKIEVKATPEQVWEALTNPEKTKKYFFNSKIYSDWQPGSKITFKGKMFLIIKFEMSGTIKEIEPQKLLKYTLKNAKSSSISNVTIRINGMNDRTIITVSDDVGQGSGAEKRYHKSEKGWTKILSGLKRVVESD